jgi:PST family polysaccharide transporter
MLSFGGFVSLTGAVYTLVKSLESLLLGRVGGAVQLGYYTRAGALVQNPMQQLMGPMGSVAIPALSRVAPEPERFRQAFLLLCELIAITVVPAVTFLAVTSDWVVALLLGPRWSQLAPIAAVMALGAFASPIAAAGTWALTTQHKGRELFLWSIVHSSLLALAIVAGLPWGALGVAAAVAVSGVLVRTPVLFWTVGKYTPAKQGDIYLTILPPVACAAGVSALIWAFRFCFPIKGPLAGLACTGMIATTAYVLILLISPHGRRTLRLLNDLRLRLRP